MKIFDHSPLSSLRKRCGSPRGARGFTLIELLLVIAIMGILMGVGLPSFRSMVINMRIKNASFDFYSSLLAARNEAMTRNTTVTVTPVSGAFNNGWNVTAVIASVTTTLKTQDAFPAGLAFSGAPASIVYNSSGRLNAAVAPITLYAAGASGGSVGRCISVDLSGRPVTAKGVC